MSFFKFLNPKYHKVKKEIKLYSKLKMKDEEVAFYKDFKATACLFEYCEYPFEYPAVYCGISLGLQTLCYQSDGIQLVLFRLFDAAGSGGSERLCV